jgi:hypothetical protein
MVMMMRIRDFIHPICGALLVVLCTIIHSLFFFFICFLFSFSFLVGSFHALLFGIIMLSFLFLDFIVYNG